MSDEAALLAAIWAHPSDDLVRLVYADWLDERGRHERAEFIRVQCELARLEQHWEEADRIVELKRREAELWTAHKKEWRVGLPRGMHADPFRRGFVYPWRVYGGEKFLKLKVGDLSAAPIWSGKVEKYVRLFDRVFASPLLLRFDELGIEMGRQQITFSNLAGNDLLRNVTDFRLSHYTNVDQWEDPEGVSTFFNGPATVSVTRLDCYAHLGEESFAALAGSRTAGQLTHLCLSGWRLPTVNGLSGITAHFPQLRSVKLDTRNFFALLMQSPGVRIRKLDLNMQGLTDDRIVELALWPGLANVRWLDLTHSSFRRAGFLALARSPHANGLRHLKVDEFYLRELPEVKAELDARFGSFIEYADWSKR